VAVRRWKEAGLLKPSVLKPLVATIERGLIRRKLGRLHDEDRRALRAALDAILGA
jgi:mRNA interferase MazF